MRKKVKKFRLSILGLWTLVGVVLLILINTQGYSDLLDRLVKVFIFTSPVTAGLIAYLKIKENRLKNTD